MKKTLICAVVAMILAVSGVANGNVITVDPDAFPAGTVLNNSYPGVRLSAVGDYDGADGNVYALTDSLASTGTKVFGNSSNNPGMWGFDTSFQAHLRVDFDSLVMSVMIDAIGDNSEDYGRLEAYSSTGVLLDVYETGWLQTGDVETMSISRISADIAYILVAGKDPGLTPHHTVHLDNLNYVIKQAMPPIAHADGPYTIYEDDTLMLDASGSTDDDNDIVSYMWDIDDDGTFETDAGNQAVFTVDYSYLDSVGLVVGGPYDIHVKVTDSHDQSDIADSTLTIIPLPVIEVAVDINPNTLNLKSKGKWIMCHIWLPEGYDVTDVNSYSVTLEDEIEAEWIWFDEDQQVVMVKFSRSAVQEMLADLETPSEVELLVSGELVDGTIFEGTDTIRVIDKGRRKNNSAGKAIRRIIVKRK